MVKAYHNQKVLVTGGLGFIGSNLAIRLARAGARVTVVDSSVPGCGANPHNLCAAEGAVRVIEADIRDCAALAGEIRGCFAVFNLAGEISHIHSMLDPARDADLNATAQLLFLEECTRQAPGVRVVYASTRQIYGAPQYLPVDEQHPVRPVDFNGISKYAATAYHLMWSTMGRLDAIALCLTNVYGPRIALNAPCQGFLGNFIRRALLGQTIEIFGDGRQLRDPVYVDDVVDAFLLAGVAREPRTRQWNVGGPAGLPLSRIAEIAAREAGAPEPILRPFPEDRKKIDIGSYVTDSRRIREEAGWRPQVEMEDGLQRTFQYFRSELPHYLPRGAEQPVCAFSHSGPLRIPVAV
ncbi:MAG TPA: NAD-dependent epimerase/dehydratase family protein [Bryobacteraceae bacterium]